MLHHADRALADPDPSALRVTWKPLVWQVVSFTDSCLCSTEPRPLPCLALIFRPGGEQMTVSKAQRVSRVPLCVYRNPWALGARGGQSERADVAEVTKIRK